MGRQAALAPVQDDSARPRGTRCGRVRSFGPRPFVASQKKGQPSNTPGCPFCVLQIIRLQGPGSCQSPAGRSLPPVPPPLQGVPQGVRVQGEFLAQLVKALPSGEQFPAAAQVNHLLGGILPDKDEIGADPPGGHVLVDGVPLHPQGEQGLGRLADLLRVCGGLPLGAGGHGSLIQLQLHHLLRVPVQPGHPGRPAAGQGQQQAKQRAQGKRPLHKHSSF